ncbi:MAG: helix-turn-helix domain-containing protein, partial [Actinomycetota bacterium]|nr:helix-turn-helix domain-containing protein [Actinomycetota bacterium]
MSEQRLNGNAMADVVSAGKLGTRVRELRLVRGLTLEALAERSSVSRAMISKLERGDKNPTLV